MQIELQPHVGQHCATGRQVDLKQDRIFADGEHVGYVGRQPGAPINLIVPDPPAELRAAVAAAVAAKYGQGERKLAAPPVIDQLPPEDDGDSD